MSHLRALALKFIASLVLLYIILGLFYGMSFGNVFTISLVLGIISYIVGDLILLPRTSNTVATITDFALAFMVIWFMGVNMVFRGNLFTMSLIGALGVAAFEYFFHRYIANNVFSNGTLNRSQGQLQYQTEISEELTPVRPDVRSKDEE